MGRVFVAQAPRLGLDISKAERYGTFEFLFPPGTLSRVPSAMLNDIMRKLHEFKQDDDYVLAIGDLVAMLVVGACLQSEGHTEVNVLRYDNRAMDYHVVNVPMYSLLWEGSSAH